MQLRESWFIFQRKWIPPHPNPLPGGERESLLNLNFWNHSTMPPLLLIDDRSAPDLLSCLGTRWRGVSDTVMGGVSQGRLSVAAELGRPCLCLQGEVSLANSGGFVQASLDLSVAGFLDSGVYAGSSWMRAGMAGAITCLCARRIRGLPGCNSTTVKMAD